MPQPNIERHQIVQGASGGPAAPVWVACHRHWGMVVKAINTGPRLIVVDHHEYGRHKVGGLIQSHDMMRLRKIGGPVIKRRPLADHADGLRGCESFAPFADVRNRVCRAIWHIQNVITWREVFSSYSQISGFVSIKI